VYSLLALLVNATKMNRKRLQLPGMKRRHEDSRGMKREDKSSKEKLDGEKFQIWWDRYGNST